MGWSNFALYPLDLVGDFNIDSLKQLESASAQNFINLMFVKIELNKTMLNWNESKLD